MKSIKITLISAAALAFLACGSDEQSQVTMEAAVPVKIYQVKLRPFEQTESYAGTVEPLENVRLSTKIMGWVDEILPEGTAFGKGEVLVRLRSEDLQAKQGQAVAAIAEATTHFENAESNLKRIEVLFEKGAATQKELDDMRSHFASAKSGKIRAQEMKTEVDELLRYAIIRAPFAGVVGRKYVDPGDMANPGQPILDIENGDRVKIVAKVPESSIRDLATGQTVRVTVEAAQAGTNGSSLEGKITRIVPAADAMSRQFEIHVVLGNATGEIRSGMFARVWAPGAENFGTPVPQSALFRRGQLQGLFVVGTDLRANLRWVRTGRMFDDFVDIVAGLNEGETVVLNPANLSDGQRVEVK